MKKQVLLVEGIHPQAKEIFEKHNFAVQALSSSSDAKELLKIQASALGIRSRTQLTSSFFNQAQNLLSVGAFCIGTNQIDLKQATVNGVAVFNSPYSNTRSVAELVVANIVNLSRKITYLNQLTHTGTWKKSSKSSFEVRGKTLGIIGYGHIGTQVSILAEAFSMNVIYYDIQKKLPIGNAKSLDSLKEVLSEADFVTLHVPQTPQTQNMITKKELTTMKQGAYLINTSRGSVVNLKDLVEALKSKKLQGAAIDVFPEEPASNEEVFSNELQKLDNVILTPHIGGSTEEAQVGIARDVSDRLTRYLIHGDSSGSVNFPQLSPPLKEDSICRIANVHKNIPGVLSQINQLISQSGANVKTQYLATVSEMGYLIIDLESINKEQEKKLIHQIQNLDASIKTRTLSE